MPHSHVDWFAVIIADQVHILQLFSDGVNSLMGILKPSYVLGADLIFTETGVSPYYAIADSPCKTWIFSRNLFIKNDILPDPVRLHIWQRLITSVAQDNMRKHYRLAILTQHGLRNRVLVYLTMQAGRKGSNTVQLPLSRDEMADFLCVNRSSLFHELSKMAQEVLIWFNKNQFTLLAEGLEKGIWSVD